MVKCSECGFLTYRHATTRELVEVTERVRETGSIPVGDNNFEEFFSIPICFARAASLKEEIHQNALESMTPERAAQVANSPRPEHIVPVTHLERDCDQFTPWQLGLTPKEHRDHEETLRLREWQASREDADRAWREQQAEIDHRFRRREMAILLVTVVVAVVIPIVAAVIQAFLSR